MKTLKQKQRLSILVPDWLVPEHILACTTMRQDLLEGDSFANFNLAMHVGDDLKSVDKNRNKLVDCLALPSMPIWLEQTHSTTVLNLDTWEDSLGAPQADAAFTTQKSKVCVVLTADCLPLIVTDTQGKGVLAIHAGWKGLANGIIQIAIEKFTQALNIDNSACCVWLGPGISQDNFEVGADVYTKFVDASPLAAKAFKHKGSDKYLCNLYLLAQQILDTLGVNKVSGGTHCTYAQEDEFYSYRRHTHQLKDAAEKNATKKLPSFLREKNTQLQSFTQDCGRQATLIWLSDNN